MARVALAQAPHRDWLAVRSASGLEPREVLERIAEVTQELTAAQARIFGERVVRRWSTTAYASSGGTN